VPISTWIRDLFGIRKDAVETKKAELEITKLEDEEGERRGLVDLATLDDVKKYDPKTKQLLAKITQTIINILAIIGMIFLLLLSINSEFRIEFKKLIK
jgi:hypothetical protein